MQFLVLLVLVAVVFVSAQKHVIPALKNHSKKFSRAGRTADSNLRGNNVSPKVDPQSYVSTHGYFEAVVYGLPTCSHPEFKEIYPIQMCAPSVENPPYYTKAWVYSETDYRYYDIYQQDYYDSACTQAESDPFFLDSFEILICSDYTYFHVIPAPLNPRGDNLGITLMTFDSQENCFANKYKEGALESIYARLDKCYESESGDLKFTSCNPEGSLNMKQFTSTDGTCTGDSTFTQVYHSCDDSGMSTLNGFVYGWLNFNCAKNPV